MITAFKVKVWKFTKIGQKKNRLLSLFFLKLYVIYNYTLISTSTPLGNSSFIKASIVFEEEL